MRNVSAVGENFEYLDSEEQEIITSLCGRNAIQITPEDPKELSLKNIAQTLKNWAVQNVQII
jgi:adenylyltransferase/sulfurtransferase